MAAPAIAFDHLVVACASLDAGRAWCEAALGAVAQPGGRHARMGTHNVLLALGSPRFPRAYLELIAIDPAAPPPGQPRWFDLDRPALQAALTEPRLVHWGARSSDIVATVAACRDAGHDPGPIVAAERATARGVLRWKITLPLDGTRAAAGALPLWIEWGSEHPVDALPASGVGLESLRVSGLDARLQALLPSTVEAGEAGSPLCAVLSTPRGRVTLAAPRLPLSA